MTFLNALLTNPTIIFRQRNIFLLSHMRANTSLFGHLMGSHPWVEGYYEMHIGYYNWKSLWRQRLRHFADHPAKPGARFMFDKILHDGHYIAPHLLQNAQSRTIFMLRSPEQSIKSLIVLYRQRSPQLPEATIEGAAQYYIERLATLGSIAEAISGRYFYLDAEALIEATTPTLVALSDWLGFDTPIPSEYQTFSKTGMGNTGDHSSRLKSGQVSKASSNYSDIVIDPALIDAANTAYQTHRTNLIQGSERHALM
jgi:hypothetical protein